MKIKFLATNNAPDYTIDGETITINGEVLDLSEFPEGATFEGVEGDEDNFVRNVERTDGELFVTLCQASPVTKITYMIEGKPITLAVDQPEPETYDRKIEHRGGNWTESDWINDDDYNPETLYIKEL